ncbi:hypothetical protein N665_1561s0011 [Sinapis alba]|nr:hypothetical protein N665_1561s0011 [Sinapis alba]
MASMQRTNHFRWGNLDDHTCPEFDDAGLHLTVRSTEDIHLERLVVKRKKQRHQEIQFGVFMVCRLCRMRGDHWTSRCPQRDPSYVPISMRAGADRRNTASSDMRRNSLRVTNLSEDTREQDVMEWFSAYGYDNNLILRG